MTDGKSYLNSFPAHLVVPFAPNMFTPYGLESHFGWLNALRSPLHREQLTDVSGRDSAVQFLSQTATLTPRFKLKYPLESDGEAPHSCGQYGKLWLHLSSLIATRLGKHHQSFQ